LNIIHPSLWLVIRKFLTLN